MLQAVQIMLLTVLIAVITGFLVSLLIQVLSNCVGSGEKKNGEKDETELIALAVAVALHEKAKRKQG